LSIELLTHKEINIVWDVEVVELANRTDVKVMAGAALVVATV
jgi:hypothetical protein